MGASPGVQHVAVALITRRPLSLQKDAIHTFLLAPTASDYLCVLVAPPRCSPRPILPVSLQAARFPR